MGERRVLGRPGGRHADLHRALARHVASSSATNALQREYDDARELLELGEDEARSRRSSASLERELGGLQEDALFDGQYDAGDAILEIHAGTGGTDAQDWADMLLRMYLRWASDRRLRHRGARGEPR